MQNRKLRKVSHATVAASAIALLFSAAAAMAQPAKSASLDTVLAQMNAASAKFTSAQADLRQDLYTKAIRDTETQNGQIYFLRHAGSTQMGMKMFAPGAAAGSAPVKIMQFQNGVAQVLTPGTGQVDEFLASGKNQSAAEAMTTLGFGGSGNDLKKTWTITDMGADTVDGVNVEKLDLVSKDPAIQKTWSHITIWLDPVRDVSLKQVSYDASSGDTRTVIYSNIRLNQTVNSSGFQINCKGKCTVVKH